MAERVSTTFHADFIIAERFGISAIEDTFKRAFDEWKGNYLYLTELAMVVNALCWEHYGRGESQLMELYADYYYKVRDYAYDNLTDDELQHYYEVTDQLDK